MRSRRRLSVAIATAGASIGALVLLTGLDGAVAHADNCSSPADCEETAGYNSIIAVVGGAAAVIAAAAAAAAATGASSAAAAGAAAGAAGDGAAGDEPPEEPPEVVIIQVNPGEIEVGPDAPAQVRLTAWRSIDGAPPTLAPDIPLTISAPPGSGLQLVPNQGTGDLTVTVSLVGTPTGDQAVLVASGTSQAGTATANVTVRFTAGYDLELY